jgi:hypothetical protein
MGDKGNEYVEIMDGLEARGFDLSEMYALDAFAREGLFRTIDYANRVKHLTAWEINENLCVKFSENFPNALVRCCDSHEAIKEKGEDFDMIVLDAPGRVYGAYCEHFDIIEDALKRLKRDRPVVLVLNVFNLTPRTFASYVDHVARRSEFYGQRGSFSNEFLKKFYARYFAQRGFMLKYIVERKHLYVEGYNYWACVLEAKDE